MRIGLRNVREKRYWVVENPSPRGERYSFEMSVQRRTGENKE